MTIIRMDYTGRNGRVYPCLFSPKAVREHWKKGQTVTLEYESAAGTVYFHIYPIGYMGLDDFKVLSMFVRDRVGNVPVKHHFNGFRAETDHLYVQFFGYLECTLTAWWC